MKVVVRALVSCSYKGCPGDEFEEVIKIETYGDKAERYFPGRTPPTRENLREVAYWDDHSFPSCQECLHATTTTMRQGCRTTYLNLWCRLILASGVSIAAVTALTLPKASHAEAGVLIGIKS